MKVFLAGAYSAKDDIKDVRGWLQEQGHEVTSTWLDEPPNAPTDRWGLKTYGLNDLYDLRRSDTFAVIAHWPSTTGGWYTELGVALERGLAVHIVGSVGTQGVYCALEGIQRHENVRDFLETLGVCA